MKNIIALFILTCLLQSCSNERGQEASIQEERNFTSEMKDGKLTTDFSTAQELKSMRNTIENFTLLSNKKKLENLKAYQQFGDLLQMHTERVTKHCRLDADSKNLLCKKLDKVKSEVQTLHGDDMEKSKAALKNVNAHLAEIDSSFSYMN
jgi:hypothetical protein